jgi:hypothetical protein
MKKANLIRLIAAFILAVNTLTMIPRSTAAQSPTSTPTPTNQLFYVDYSSSIVVGNNWQGQLTTMWNMPTDLRPDAQIVALWWQPNRYAPGGYQCSWMYTGAETRLAILPGWHDTVFYGGRDLGWYSAANTYGCDYVPTNVDQKNNDIPSPAIDFVRVIYYGNPNTATPTPTPGPEPGQNMLGDAGFELWTGENEFWYHDGDPFTPPSWYCDNIGSSGCIPGTTGGPLWLRNNYNDYAEDSDKSEPPNGFGGDPIGSFLHRLANGNPLCENSYQVTYWNEGTVWQDFTWSGGPMFYKIGYKGDTPILGMIEDGIYGTAHAWIVNAQTNAPVATIVNAQASASWQYAIGSAGEVAAGTYRFLIASEDGRQINWDDSAISNNAMDASCGVSQIATPTPTITTTPGTPTTTTTAYITATHAGPTQLPTWTPRPTATRTGTPTRTVTPRYTTPTALYSTRTPTGTPVPATAAPQPSATAYTTATQSSYIYTPGPTVTPGGPTITPGGQGPPLQPQPGLTLTPCSGENCDNLPIDNTRCIRPPAPQNSGALSELGNIFTGISQLPWWMDYEVCEIKDWFALKPQHVATLVSLPTRLANKEPFGTIREFEQGSSTLQAKFDELDKKFKASQPLDGIRSGQATPNPDMFIPASNSPWNGAPISFGALDGNSRSIQCTSTFTDTLGSLLAPGACTIFNILRDIHMLPWFQFMIDLTCILIIIISTIKSFTGQAKEIVNK